jgi:hypothetical protein
VTFRTEALRVRVGLKERADPIPLCYCFGFDEKDGVGRDRRDSRIDCSPTHCRIDQAEDVRVSSEESIWSLLSWGSQRSY